MTRRFTVALRVCLNCQRTFGVGLWPWSGSHYTRTHGLCRPCHRQLQRAFDDERAPRETSAAADAAPPAA